MWAVLHLCAPKFFTSYWKYVNTFCVVDDTPFGKQIVGVKNVEGWRNTIGPYVFHRKKNTKDYPQKTRQALEVEMEPWQRKIHDDLKKRLLTILESGDIVLVKNTLEATIKIRQLMICPKFIDPSLDWGSSLEGIWDDAEESELSHFVVSTPFVGPIPLIKEFFQQKTGKQIQALRGGMSPDEIDEAIARWTQDGGPIIQSIQFAESYELPAARIMYMLGYMHDPEANMQAEDRIHRDIRVTPDPVDIYYVKNLGSYDEKIIEAMSMHADNVHELMNMPITKVFNL
jgi:SNF2 family DNA or RNA helicase